MMSAEEMMDVFEVVKKQAEEERSEYVAKAVNVIIDASKHEAKALNRKWNRYDDITKFNTYAHVWAYVVCHDLPTILNHEHVKVDIFYRISKALFEEATK